MGGWLTFLLFGVNVHGHEEPFIRPHAGRPLGLGGKQGGLVGGLVLHPEAFRALAGLVAFGCVLGLVLKEVGWGGWVGGSVGLGG